MKNSLLVVGGMSMDGALAFSDIWRRRRCIHCVFTRCRPAFAPPLFIVKILHHSAVLSRSVMLERDLTIGAVSVRPSFCMPVTRRDSLKTNDHMIVQFSAPRLAHGFFF